MYSWHHCMLRSAEAAAAKPHMFLAGCDGSVGGSLRQGSPIFVTSWLHGTQGAAAVAVDAGWRSLCGSSRRSCDSNPAQTLQSLFWKVLIFEVHFFLHIQNPAQLNWLFSVLFQCHHCCLPQPHPPLHPQQTKVCPSEVLCAVLTAVNAQGFMLYFGGEEIPCIQVCEVFFFSIWSQLSWSSHCLKTYPTSCFEVHFCRFKHYYFGVKCLFLVLSVSKQSVINKYHMKQKMWQNELLVSLGFFFLKNWNGEGVLVALSSFSFSLVPWAAGVSAFLFWVIMWTREGWLRCQCQTARVEQQRVYMDWYHSDLVAATNHNCCLLQLLYKGHEKQKNERFLDWKIATVMILCLKMMDDDANVSTDACFVRIWKQSNQKQLKAVRWHLVWFV